MFLKSEGQLFCREPLHLALPISSRLGLGYGLSAGAPVATPCPVPASHQEACELCVQPLGCTPGAYTGWYVSSVSINLEEEVCSGTSGVYKTSKLELPWGAVG